MLNYRTTQAICRDHAMQKRTFLKTCSALALNAGMVNTARSASERELRIIVPFAPHGVSSLLAEEVCLQMRGPHFDACVVEHIPGMTNMVATRTLLRRANDASITLMIAGPSIFTIGQHLNPFMSIKPTEDLTVLGALMRGPMVLVTSAKSGLDTWEKLAEYSGPKKCAVSGLGSPSHVVAAYIDSSLFSLGSAYTTEGDLPGIEQVLKGHVSCAVVSIGSCRNHMNGSLNFLLSSSQEPITWPDKQTTPSMSSVAQQRRATDFVFDNWLAIVGPKTMSTPRQDMLKNLLHNVTSSPAMNKLIASLLHQPLNISPKDMMERIQNNASRWDSYVNRLQLNQALNLDL
jgi:tripartite-type tricarboxylate transporter receptor subunit TctC